MTKAFSIKTMHMSKIPALRALLAIVSYHDRRPSCQILKTLQNKMPNWALSR